MKIYANVKALAKKKPVIEKISLDIPAGITNSNQLIEAIVRQNVRAFNSKQVDLPLFPYLSSDELADQLQSGRVGFSDKKNENPQDEEAAVKNALQCYEDGIYRVYINEKEAGFNEAVSLEEGEALTFIRLTMLAGRLW